jgi:hypothetical protein
VKHRIESANVEQPITLCITALPSEFKAIAERWSVAVDWAELDLPNAYNIGEAFHDALTRASEG